MALHDSRRSDEGGPRRGRPVGDREAKRIELLTAGLKVIAEEGFGGASLRKVARRAGHTTGAVAYYFENKEQLFAAIIEHLFDRFDETLDPAKESDDLRQRFKYWLELNSDSSIWAAGFQLLAQARLEPALADIYQRRYARYREISAQRLAKEQRAGLIRNDIPADILADLLSALGDGWATMQPIEPARFAPERVDRLLDALILQLSPTRG